MKTKKLFSRAIAFFLFVFAVNANANNVQISGTTVVGNQITFEISWDNSWYANVAPANYDAVWVFIKYQDCNTRLWAHAGLSATSSDHSTSSPLVVDAVTDGKGVFIHRNMLGGGTIAPTSVTLTMTIPAGTYNYKVYGIEMVNVPQASFEIGDATSTSTFNNVSIGATQENSGVNAATLGGGATTLPGAFPVGYNAFYVMKYEISQLQYVEYLNALTYDQQRKHTISDPIGAAGTYAFANAARSGIIIVTPGNNAAIPAVYGSDGTPGIENNIDDGQSLAVNYLSWSDLSAYLDWSALRPMSELEFEKVCRGTMSRVAGEYPWGTTDTDYVHPGQVVNGFKPNEGYNTSVNGLANYYVYQGYPIYGPISVYGPVKVGFSATSSSGRASAAASYYGAMEMGGNVTEMVVVANADGLSFTGANGDGTITANGDANTASWPSNTTALGIGLRGGSFGDQPGLMRTSDRSAVTTAPSTRGVNYGGRGVRN